MLWNHQTNNLKFSFQQFIRFKNEKSKLFQDFILCLLKQ